MMFHRCSRCFIVPLVTRWHTETATLFTMLNSLYSVTFYFPLSDVPENGGSSFRTPSSPLFSTPLSPLSLLSPLFWGVLWMSPVQWMLHSHRLQRCPPSRANKASFWRGKKSFPSPLSPLSPWERGSWVWVKLSGGMGTWGLRLGDAWDKRVHL